MGNPVVHWELMSKEPAKVAAFHEKLFVKYFDMRHDNMQAPPAETRHL